MLHVLVSLLKGQFDEQNFTAITTIKNKQTYKETKTGLNKSGHLKFGFWEYKFLNFSGCFKDSYSTDPIFIYT